MNKILVIGSMNMDIVIKVKDMVKAGQTIYGEGPSYIPGGKGANQAYAAACLGAQTSMIAMVGNDDYADVLVGNLKTAGVNTDTIRKRTDCYSGMAVISVDDQGENSIIVLPGANAKVTPDYIDENISKLQECDILMMQMEIPLETVVYAAKKARDLGKIVILDPAPVPASLPEDFFQHFDMIKPNETELEALTGIPTDSEENIVRAARQLIQAGVKTVIVTLGKKGAYLVEKDRAVLIPSPQVEVKDTTAAGDTFIAAVASRLLGEEPLEEVIKFANIVSSIVVSRSGAQTSIPKLDEVNEYIKR